jgi:hypothetical protein
MKSPFQAGISAIVRYIEHWQPGISIERTGGETVEIVVRGGAKEVVLRYGAELDDLERALKDENLPAPYKNGVIRDYTRGALIAVGKQGLAPDVDVSKLVLDEKLDWNRRVRLRTSFDAETSKKLYEGLKVLDAFAQSLTKAEVAVPEIETEHEVMASMITHYERTGSLNEDALGESLSYLKAATLLWIQELEEQKRSSASPRLKTARSVRLFEPLGGFWGQQPWNRIPLPSIAREYIAQRPEAVNGAPHGPGPSLDIGPQLMRRDPRLEERWRGAWEALRSQNPDKVSQAANSMVEVLDKVIGCVCNSRPFREVLAERYPKQEEVVLTKLKYVSALKTSLQSVKHETKEQSMDTAQDLMHASEGVIRTLLR